MLYLNAKKLSSILMLVIKSKKLRQWLETQQGTIKSSFLTYTTTQGEKSYQGKSQIPLSRSLFSKPFSLLLLLIMHCCIGYVSEEWEKGHTCLVVVLWWLREQGQLVFGGCSMVGSWRIGKSDGGVVDG
jgi:hypothetical protein